MGFSCFTAFSVTEPHPPELLLRSHDGKPRGDQLAGKFPIPDNERVADAGDDAVGLPEYGSLARDRVHRVPYGVES